jgi:hypothetical protein
MHPAAGPCLPLFRHDVVVVEELVLLLLKLNPEAVLFTF